MGVQCLMVTAFAFRLSFFIATPLLLGHGLLRRGLLEKDASLGRGAWRCIFAPRRSENRGLSDDKSRMLGVSHFRQTQFIIGTSLNMGIKVQRVDREEKIWRNVAQNQDGSTILWSSCMFHLTCLMIGSPQLVFGTALRGLDSARWGCLKICYPLDLII